MGFDEEIIQTIHIEHYFLKFIYAIFCCGFDTCFQCIPFPRDSFRRESGVKVDAPFQMTLVSKVLLMQLFDYNCLILVGVLFCLFYFIFHFHYSFLMRLECFRIFARFQGAHRMLYSMWAFRKDIWLIHNFVVLYAVNTLLITNSILKNDEN